MVAAWREHQEARRHLLWLPLFFGEKIIKFQKRSWFLGEDRDLKAAGMNGSSGGRVCLPTWSETFAREFLRKERACVPMP